MNKRIAFLAGFLFSSSPVLAAGDLNDVPPNIEVVGSGGFWKSNDKEGRYRLIVVNGGTEHVSSQVYLQWTTPSLVVRTVPIQEINSEAVWSVDAPEFLYSKGPIRIKLAATNSYSNESKVFFITPSPDGKYQIREGAN